MSSKRDYDVGYKKPPKHTRFRAGESGNPKGRPPRSKNFSTLLGKALDEPVIAVDSGRRRTISKREAIIAQLVNGSAQGDLKAIHLLVNILENIERRQATTVPDSLPFTEEDQEIIEHIKSRITSET